MEIGVAASAAETAFDYNRSNFRFDREMRVKKELFEMSVRIAQTQLWREDIRDIVALVERKMKSYLLVSVLMLSFTVVLWCEGRLPVGSPEWLMIGNQVAICGAFIFLLLTVWLATHANVVAHSFQTRLLTQLVRLPVPTYDEIQACRTFASEYEKVEPRQMFRVPFLTGRQEGFVPNTDTSETHVESTVHEDSTSSTIAVDGEPETFENATDPWGLERCCEPRPGQSPDATDNLGCGYGAEVVKLRHIKLLRQAAVFWQTYDAFARLCMSIGANQLILAMTYYILGYVLLQVGNVAAAFAGTIALLMLAQSIAHLDMDLTRTQRFMINTVLSVGPLVACISMYRWASGTHLGRVTGQVLIPVAFVMHGTFVWLLTSFCKVQKQDGAMLPTAFKSVLFLDVFGWIADEEQTSPSTTAQSKFQKQVSEADSCVSDVHEHEQVVQVTSDPSEGRGGDAILLGKQTDGDKVLGSMSTSKASLYNNYVHDYMTPEHSSGGETDQSDTDGEANAHKPSLSVKYDGMGRPCPTCPRDHRPPDAHVDMRFAPGAPRMWDQVRADNASQQKVFYDATTFVPPKLSANSNMQKRGIVTGHEGQDPGILPWRVFKTATFLLLCVWIVSAFYALLSGLDIWKLQIPFPWEEPDFGIHHTRDEFKQSLLGLWAAGITGELPGQGRQKLDVVWPYRHIVPKDLACDSTGTHFVVSDGLSLFTAHLRQEQTVSYAQNSPKSGNLRHAGILNSSFLEFEDLAHCRALQGQSLQDATVVCSTSRAPEAEDCEALALHQGGTRVAACNLGQKTGFGETDADESHVSNISSFWLDPVVSNVEADNLFNKDEPVKTAETVSWLTVDPTCEGDSTRALSQGCTFAGTSNGRMVQLQSQSTGAGAGSELVPLDIIYQDEHHQSGISWSEVGTVRAFNSKHFGVLQPRSRSILVVDSHQGGVPVGFLMLPRHKPVDSFCVGGGNIYLLTKGSMPEMWQMPVPKTLWAPEATKLLF